jgi:hypothetical protein
MTENRLKCIHIFLFREPDRVSHKTQIRFSEFSESFIGSSCSSAITLLPLLFFCLFYYYSSFLLFFSHIAIPLLPLLFFSLYYYYSLFYSYCCSILLLLLFSHCSYSFPVAVTFLTWCLLFSCDEVI